jgi:hypothetical protein
LFFCFVYVRDDEKEERIDFFGGKGRVLCSSCRSRGGGGAVAGIHVARQLGDTGFDSRDAGFDGYSHVSIFHRKEY